MKFARLLYTLMVFVIVCSPVANAFGCPMENMNLADGQVVEHSATLRDNHQQSVRNQVPDSSVAHVGHVNGAGHSHCVHPDCSNGGHCGYVVISSRTLHSGVPRPAALLHAVHPSPISGQTSLPFRPPIGRFA